MPSEKCIYTSSNVRKLHLAPFKPPLNIQHQARCSTRSILRRCSLGVHRSWCLPSLTSLRWLQSSRSDRSAFQPYHFQNGRVHQPTLYTTSSMQRPSTYLCLVSTNIALLAPAISEDHVQDSTLPQTSTFYDGHVTHIVLIFA
jgi:hypothetical protein